MPASVKPPGVEPPLQIKIEVEDDIVTVRQAVRERAKENGFDPFAIAAITTAASELSRNAWVHAGGGNAKISVLRNDGKVGIELECSDHGPGISDVERVLAGGYSTIKSLGLGLSGTKRLVDEFQINTKKGQGTKIVIRKWKKTF